MIYTVLIFHKKWLYPFKANASSRRDSLTMYRLYDLCFW